MNASLRGVSAKKLAMYMGILALLLAVLAGPAGAQTFRGTIIGTVTDASGAVVPGAKVVVKNDNTGLARETSTTDDGSYSVPELPIGDYTVTVEKSGFQTSVTRGVKVEVALERRVDVSLKAGDVATRVEVTAETLATIETTSNVLGGNFSSSSIEALPINGRDYTKLLIMVPGAAGEPNGGGDSPGSYGLFSVNGNRGRSNNFLLDGTDMNDGFRNLPAINQGGVFGTPGTVLPVESIAELKVLANTESEFGRNSGSVVNIVTKSGTNDIHGSVFWFFRDDALNARNYFNEKPNPKDEFRNHQFGVGIGGPLVKDKTFWYFAYEGQREDVGITSLNSVPTLADYATAVAAIGGNSAACATGTIINCINAQGPGVINTVIRNLYNLCDTSGGCSGGRDVWPTSTVSSAPAFNRADSFIFKMDHSFSENQTLTGRYFYGRSDQSFPLGLAGGNNLPGTNTFSPINAQFLSLSYVQVINPRIVNETRFGWNRYKQDFLAADREVFGNPNTSIGLNTEISNPNDFGLPTIRVSGLAALGSAPFSNPRGRVGNNIHVINNTSWKVASHDLKFGYEFRYTNVDSFLNIQYRGILGFDGGVSGDSLGDFLAGNVAGGRIVFGNSSRRSTQPSHALYFQDSWRATRNLNVNLGVRWDYFGVLREDKGRFSRYDPASGLALTNDLYDSDALNFSPRLSAAWDVFGKGKTVIRAGFGIFYDIFSHDFFTGQIPFNCFSCPGVAYNPVGPDPVFVSLSPVATLAAGVPVYNRAVNGPNDTTDIFVVDRNLKTPYVMQYSLNVQQDLWGFGVLQVGYVGTQGRRLIRYRDINQADAATIRAADLACVAAAPRIGNVLGDGCTYSVPRPFDTAAPLSGLAPNQPFYVNQLESSSNSNYNSLQVSFQQRNWRHFTNQVTYTWSHSIDDASDGQDFVPNATQPNDSQNARGDRGNSNFDVRHRFVWSLTYEVPQFGPWEVLTKGWSISNVLTLMSGHPFHINNNFVDDYDGSGQFFGRPDVAGPVRYNRSNPRQFLDVTSFAVPCTFADGDITDPPDGVPETRDGSALFCVAGSRHFGTLGRNSLLGPDYRNMDFSVTKVTNLTERFALHLRFDFYNIFNHPNFASPLLPAFFADAAPGGIDPATGRGIGFLPITATSDIGLGNPILGGGGPRSVQFAVKIVF